MSTPLSQEYLDKKLDQKFDDFAIIVNKGFQTVQGQFGTVNQHFVSVNQRIDETNQRIDETNQRIDKLYDAVDGFMKLHTKLDTEFTALRAAFKRLEERVVSLEKQLQPTVG